MRTLTCLAGILQLFALFDSTHAAARTATCTDPAIQYEGDWALSAGGDSQVAMKTGSTATFKFTGTSVQWRSTRAWLQSTEQLTLDGKAVYVDMSWPDASVSGNVLVVWEASGLALAEHTVVITKDSPPDKWLVVWDFIYDNAVPVYKPGITTSTQESQQSSQAPSTVDAQRTTQTTQAQVTSSPSAQSSISQVSSVRSSAESSADASSASVPSTSASSSESDFLPATQSTAVGQTGLALANTTSGSATPSSFALASTVSNGITVYVPITTATRDALSTSAAIIPGSTPGRAREGQSSSTGIIIGIAVAVAVLAIIAALVVFYVCRRKRRKEANLQAMMSERPGRYGDSARGIDGQGNWLAAGPAVSLYSRDPLSPSDSTGQSPIVPTPAQEYASLARSTLSPISPGSDLDYAGPSACPLAAAHGQLAKGFAATLLSDQTGRRERPPTYISTYPRNQATGQRPGDLALFVDTSSQSLYGDLRKGRDM